MSTQIKFCFFCLLLPLTIMAQNADTIYVADFGAKPYSYENSVTMIQAAINECKRTGAGTLIFAPGRYDIWPEGAIRKEYFISNTSSEKECPSKIKTVGLLFEDMNDLTIIGNGTTLMFHGKMITVAFEHCKNMKLQDIQIDFERPTASELRYTKVDDEGVDVIFHRDTRYEIVNGKINLYGEGWRSNRNHCIEYDPELETFKYSRGWDILAGSKAKEIAQGMVRFSTPKDFKPKVENTLTVRDIIRDQVGMFIFESKNITLDKVHMIYMHGLGIVSQYSENITMNQVVCKPKEGSGRILTSSADMMHFSGCRGKIKIDGCQYIGAQDDPVNVHGTNLRAIAKVDNRTLKLRFMHQQTYGFNAYSAGDTVAFVKPSTMNRFAKACVVSTKRESDRIIEVCFDSNVPETLELGHDCVENMSATPELEIRNCFFTRTSTRGTLVTSPRKVVIANNTYYKTGMSAILIEGDAEGWFESGPVCDVLIEGNTFIDCAYNGGPGNAIIAIHPSNTVIDTMQPVHKNIRIENNIFKTFDYPILYAKSTAGITFKNNAIVRTQTQIPKSGNKNTFCLNGCKDVVISGNKFDGYIPEQLLKTENMKKKQIKINK